MAVWRNAPTVRRGFEQIDLRPLLGRITCPALVLRGQTSIVMRRDVAEAMARTLPNGVFREVSGVGHQLILERPDAVAEQINEWLRDALG
jgi:pimeloyl-ACP methyl ester carboxylesterase